MLRALLLARWAAPGKGLARPGRLLLAAGAAAASLARTRLAAAPSLDGLTPRQRQVLAGVARGKLRKEIARELGIAEATVKTHIANACARLGVATREEAVARYVAASRRR